MRSLAVDVTKTAQPVLVEYLGCGPRDDAPSDENLSETVRQVTAQVAANMLINTLIRHSMADKEPTSEQQERLGGWVFGEELRHSLEPFSC